MGTSTSILCLQEINKVLCREPQVFGCPDRLGHHYFGDVTDGQGNQAASGKIVYAFGQDGDAHATGDKTENAGGIERLLDDARLKARLAARWIVSVALGVMDKAAAARYERVMRPADKVHQPWIDHNIGQVISGLDWLNTRFSSLPRKSELSQDVISTVVAYDFLHFCMAEVVDLMRYNALQNLASECSVHLAFHETRPEIDFGLPPLSDPV